MNLGEGVVEMLVSQAWSFANGTLQLSAALTHPEQQRNNKPGKKGERERHGHAHALVLRKRF